MRVLLDTNILTRSAQPSHSLHHKAIPAVDALLLGNHTLCIVPQVVYEFWVVATRPLDQNGLDMTVSQAQADVAKIIQKFHLFRDERGVFDPWYQLVVQHQVIGKTAHDARLVAAMKRHDISHLLTFNQTDFTRFIDIAVLTPEAVLSGTTSA